MKHIKLAGVLIASAITASGALAGEAEDIAALRALDAAYADCWKKADEEALMALFTDDVSAVPHHGDDPVLGKEALRAFWFPEGGAPTVVTHFEHAPAEVFADGDMGVVRGRFNLTFEYEGTRTTIPRAITSRSPGGRKRGGRSGCSHGTTIPGKPCMSLCNSRPPIYRRQIPGNALMAVPAPRAHSCSVHCIYRHVPRET